MPPRLRRLGVFVVAAVVASCGSTERGAASGPASTAGSGTAAEVVEVIDGDTLTVTIDGGRLVVRLPGVNAPERDECRAEAAHRELADLVAGRQVRLVRPGFDGDERDRFGRLLRQVWIEDTWVELALVESGAALSIQTGATEAATLVDAGDQAWDGRIGMWHPEACGAVTTEVAVGTIRHDPAGPDDDHADDEWVTLVDTGDDGADVGGWIVRDESSSNRMRLPEDAVIAPGGEIRIRSGCGDTVPAPPPTDLFWCADTPVWSNGGDTVIVQAPTGTVVDRVRYGPD